MKRSNMSTPKTSLGDVLRVSMADNGGALGHGAKSLVQAVIDQNTIEGMAWEQNRRFQRYFGFLTPEELDQSPRQAFRDAFAKVQEQSRAESMRRGEVEAQKRLNVFGSIARSFAARQSRAAASDGIEGQPMSQPSRPTDALRGLAIIPNGFDRRKELTNPGSAGYRV